MKETKKARGTPEEAAFLDLLRTAICSLAVLPSSRIFTHAAKLGKRVGEWAWQFMSERG